MASSRRNARGESTLRAILKSTAELVNRYGYDATTISRISKSTGKPASSIYWFFETKDELIAAALEATYSRSASSMAGWPMLGPQDDLRAHLEMIMVEQLRGSATERPVRLGLMVALEGSAANSVAQTPLRSRRRNVRRALEQWWLNVAKIYGAEEAEELATQMMRLTVAYLDGHYISDTQSSTENLQQRAEFVACCLSEAFTEVARGRRFMAHDELDEFKSQESAEVGTDHYLLSSTRQLVSERGYEGATLARICDLSGMQRSSVYWRYKDKDRLVEAAVADPFLEIMQVPQVADQQTSVNSASHVANALINCVQAAIQDRDAVRAGLLMKLQHRQPPAAASQRIQEGLADQERKLSKWLEEVAGLPETQAAAAAWSTTVLTEGLILAVAFGERYDVGVLLEVTRAMFQVAFEPADLALDP